MPLNNLQRLVKVIRLELSIWAIRKATGDPSVTQLMISARDELGTGFPSRAEIELQKIRAKPNIAVIAFQTALKSWDAAMQLVGVWGLIGLDNIDVFSRVDALVQLRSRNPILYRDVSDALIAHAATARIEGRGGFLDVFEQFIKMPYSDRFPRAAKDHLEQLLRNAAKRRTDFTANVYNRLFDQAAVYASTMISSSLTQVHDAGKELKDKIIAIRISEKAEQAQEKFHENRKHAVKDEPDYYKVLQVDPAAEPEVIESAYRRLASKYHPDVNKELDANRKMQLINEAYQVLSNPTKRAEYDRSRGSN